MYKEVRLEQGETLNKTDKYQRTLAFVYVNNLGKQVFVNKLIIDSGFSDVYSYGDYDGECGWVVGV
ncbi:thermonuclease family protein [Candidatus Pacearchaeota archaeon]|nr:thermonuclease family protein [Candidatus Pacearchaeota archaeon]